MAHAAKLGAMGATDSMDEVLSSVTSGPLTWGPYELLKNRPKAPVIWYAEHGQLFSIPCTSVDAELEFHVATVFVRITIKFVNTSSSTIHGLFAFPGKGSVTSAFVRVGAGRMIATCYVSNDEIEDVQKKKKKTGEVWFDLI
jgi:hypothetical protein